MPPHSNHRQSNCQSMINNNINELVVCAHTRYQDRSARSLRPYQHDSLIYVAVATRTDFHSGIGARVSVQRVHDTTKCRFATFYTRRQSRPININKLDHLFLFVSFGVTQRATSNSKKKPECGKCVTGARPRSTNQCGGKNVKFH